MRRPAPDPHPDQDLLQESEPVAEWLLNRHVSLAKEWLPHQYVSWRLGQASTPSLDPEQPRLTGVAQAA
jgi:acyl-[acyl-carrier-protein] desaturase